MKRKEKYEEKANAEISRKFPDLVEVILPLLAGKNRPFGLVKPIKKTVKPIRKSVKPIRTRQKNRPKILQKRPSRTPPE
jgi:hypothetical protein